MNVEVSGGLCPGPGPMASSLVVWLVVWLDIKKTYLWKGQSACCILGKDG
jgi:hypothetical protein